MKKKREEYRFLHVKSEPHVATYDEREDDYEEFVRHAAAVLYRSTKKRPIATVDMLVIRRGSADEVDVWSLADAHSGDAEQVASYLQYVDGDDFYARFDTLSAYANVLLINDVCWHAGPAKMTTAEIRMLVRRITDQFDVDLVFIRTEDTLLAKHFAGFFEQGGPFLIYAKAHCWPKDDRTAAFVEPNPEPIITSRGGQA